MTDSKVNDLSKTQRGPIAFGVLILVGGGMKYMNIDNARKSTTPTKQSIAESLPQGDADSPIDTICALKQDAKKAANAFSW